MQSALTVPLNSALLGIITSGLAVVNDGGSHHRESQVEVRIAPLNQAIQRMQSIMSAYQPHEARELLCLDMARQVTYCPFGTRYLGIY